MLNTGIAFYDDIRQSKIWYKISVTPKYLSPFVVSIYSSRLKWWTFMWPWYIKPFPKLFITWQGKRKGTTIFVCSFLEGPGKKKNNHPSRLIMGPLLLPLQRSLGTNLRKKKGPKSTPPSPCFQSGVVFCGSSIFLFLTRKDPDVGFLSEKQQPHKTCWVFLAPLLICPRSCSA